MRAPKPPRWLTVIWSCLLLIFIVPIIQQNSQSYATAHHWDQALPTFISWGIPKMGWLTSQSWFWTIFTIVATLFIYSWSVEFFSKRSSTRSSLIGKGTSAGPPMAAATTHMASMPGASQAQKVQPIEVVVPPKPESIERSQSNMFIIAKKADGLDWNKLFIVNKTEQSVKLRFNPISHTPRKDAMLLVAFGFKEFLGHAEVLASSLRMCVGVVPQGNLGFHLSLAAFSHLSFDPLAEARDHLEGYLDVVGLSRGGYLKLTDWGYGEAYSIGRDLVRRA